MGNRLRALREGRGLTQEGLARAAGVSTAVVFQLEQGRRGDVKLSTLAALAKPLGVRLGRLAEELAGEQPRGRKGE